MGYDSNECIFCYTNGLGNSSCDKSTTICFKCIDKHIGTNFTSRVVDAFKTFQLENDWTCNFRARILFYYLPVCDSDIIDMQCEGE